MSKLTETQEQELANLLANGKTIEWLDKLREYAPEQERNIPSFIVHSIERKRHVKKGGTGLATPANCTPERLEFYSSALDDEVIIETSYVEGISKKSKTERATAGMLRKLLERTRAEPGALEVIRRNLEVTMQEIEEGKKQDVNEPSWVAVRTLFERLMIELFGTEAALNHAGTDLRNIAIYILYREAEGSKDLQK